MTLARWFREIDCRICWTIWTVLRRASSETESSGCLPFVDVLMSCQPNLGVQKEYCWAFLIGWSSALEERGRNCCCVTALWKATQYFHHPYSPPIHFHTSDIINIFPCTTQVAVRLLIYPLFQLVLYHYGTVYQWTLFCTPSLYSFKKRLNFFNFL